MITSIFDQFAPGPDGKARRLVIVEAPDTGELVLTVTERDPVDETAATVTLTRDQTDRLVLMLGGTPRGLPPREPGL